MKPYADRKAAALVRSYVARATERSIGSSVEATELYKSFLRDPTCQEYRNLSQMAFGLIIRGEGIVAAKNRVGRICYRNIVMRKGAEQVTSDREASPAAKKQKRLIYQALEDYYDDSAQNYRVGHSDATIAKEIGAAEIFVKKLRESDFGPLKPPGEFAAMRAEIDRLTSELGKLRNKLDGVLATKGWSG